MHVHKKDYVVHVFCMYSLFDKKKYTRVLFSGLPKWLKKTGQILYKLIK